jgi:hypothetical protein
MKIFHLESRRGQFVILLLASLVDLDDRIPSKREVERHIEKSGYLNLIPELLESYGSKQEFLWKTELAQTRRDVVDRGWLKNTIRDAWEITENGRQALLKVRERLQAGEWDVNQLTYWSPAFRHRMGCS